MSQRQQFIIHFLEELAIIDYTLLNYRKEGLNEIYKYSDLDILVDSPSLPFITSMINDIDSIDSLNYLSSKSMTQFFIYFKDKSFIRVDCLHRLANKKLTYPANEHVHENTQKTMGLIPIPIHASLNISLYYAN